MIGMGRMKLKSSKGIKRFFRRGIVFVIFVYLVFSVTFYYSLSNSKVISNTKFIKFLLSGGNSHMISDYKVLDIVNYGTDFLFNIDISNPKSILNSGFLISGDDDIDKSFYDDYSNLDDLKRVSSYIEDPNPTDVNNPIIYIYNSHQLENYDSTNLDIYGITPNVLMASYLLREKLNSRGISTIVESADLTEFLNMNGWNHASSYRASRIFVLDKKNMYPSIKYFVDIHRDSVSRDSSTTNISGKDYARILFVVGLEHDNYKSNLEIAERINNISNKYYPGLSKGILKKEGEGVDGVYNQDISPNSVLIEVGGVYNNIDEVLNTTEALANIFDYLIGDSNE